LVLYYTPPIKNMWNVLELFFWISLFIITLIFLINDFISKDNIFIFNRIENTITMKAKLLTGKTKPLLSRLIKQEYLFWDIPVL
ncbi:MAG: hypothetical protein LUE98_04910, partial [Tannerellaceae bacterium]|nr:hypothetical protein [Tannerellaceae bacterium]